MNTRTERERIAAPTPIAPLSDLQTLIATLASKDVLARDCARQALVDSGTPAVAPLIAALASPKHTVRWEAAKALGEIGDPQAAPALIAALNDTHFDVRWLAATGLVTFQEESLIPLLVALQQEPWGAGYLHEGAHHVLRVQLGGPFSTIIAPVVTALEGLEPSLTVPLAAYHALNALRGGQD